MSRDFWMPDQSCRVCYDCDSQFTIFNRRHHCRLCGRVFCARCTTNSVPTNELKSGWQDGDRMRVCNYCFKQWKEGSNFGDGMMTESREGLNISPSSSSVDSIPSSCYSCNSGSSAGSTGYSTGPFQHVSSAIPQSPCQSEQMDSLSMTHDQATSLGKLDYLDARDAIRDHYESFSRSDDEDDEYSIYRSHSEASALNPSDDHYSTINNGQIDHIYEPHEVQPNNENSPPSHNSTLFSKNVEAQQSDYATKLAEDADVKPSDTHPESPPLSVMHGPDIEVVDYENNSLLWLPPEPQDEEDDRETLFSDDDDDNGVGENSTGHWAYLRRRSFGTGENHNRDKSNEEHRKAMKTVIDGHFRALITQLLQAENLPAADHNTDESWLDIITKLSWEAATLLKPDTSLSGGMDPGGYVKVKCIACGYRKESMVVKGIVCKKNVAHRRMSSKIDKPRLLLLGGALEYQRVANHLSSVDTLLQQEMDHLKMAVAKIYAHHPNVLLVEKSVSRYAQEYLLAKDISLVLNIKRPLLERIARCTGAQIVPSIDNLSAPRLGYCDSFYVERFREDLGSSGQGGKKLIKTLMFFEGCPKPLGCTILLKGASGDALKKVKHVVQYGVFAAYHLALETSFLADEGASLPELPLTSPIKVALPDKPSGVDRSISVIPGYNVLSSEKTQGPQYPSSPIQSRSDLILDGKQPSKIVSTSASVSSAFRSTNSQIPTPESATCDIDKAKYDKDISGSQLRELSAIHPLKGNSGLYLKESSGRGTDFSSVDGIETPSDLNSSQSVPCGENDIDQLGEMGPFKEEFPPSPSDHQSILVSLSTRCVWKGSVCERAHLCRIKYYGNFDKPLGRFLWDQLFDQGYRCSSCEMPSEAHVYCYTHRQGSLTISVKRFPQVILPGEREGKIWMWHRCLRCPRTNGFPPATKRVVMSDAAWGLSFGKFLELSFSNHAAASRVASCGHSIHRDCLRFYGFGRMVGCFRYAPINVHSVFLPPLQLEFNYEQEWIKKELDDVISRASVFFTEVSGGIHQISERITNRAGIKAPESSERVGKLEVMLQTEKEEFEESLRCILNKEVKCGQQAVDIFEVNRLRRQLAFHAYVWDQRLRHFLRSIVRSPSSLLPEENPSNYLEKHGEMDVVSRAGRGFRSWDFSFLNLKPDIALTDVEHDEISSPNRVSKGVDVDPTLSSRQGAGVCLSSDINLTDLLDNAEQGKFVRRARSEGQFIWMENISDNLDAAWSQNSQSENVASKGKVSASVDKLPFSGMISTTLKPVTSDLSNQRVMGDEIHPIFPTNGPINMEDPSSWVNIPFTDLHQYLNKDSLTNSEKLGQLSDYNPLYISFFRDLIHQGEARLMQPMAFSNAIVPIYDDEPTSIISYALVSPDYQKLMSEEPEKHKDSFESSKPLSILDFTKLLSVHSLDETASVSMRSLGSADESILSTGSRSFLGLDPVLFSNNLHPRVTFSDDGPRGKVKYSVTCYFAMKFESLRRTCASELDFIRSLSRCKNWGAQGGKSNVFFAKTLDDRFIIKQMTKTELESFITFAPSYFKYLSDSISTGCPTCLAKILGIYQVTAKHLKSGKESRMDVLVMENLLFGRNITRLYDLKGSSRSRYNADTSGSNKVLLDQNLIEAMPTSPIFLGTKAKRLLERAVWNDTAFLASIDVMDYSLLVGVDEEKNELVLGIIDFVRQYTWDKHLETWVKASGILGGPKNASPTVISPKQYKRRFRKAMSAYFLMVPDQWPSSVTLPHIGSLSDMYEENSQDSGRKH